MSLGWSRVCSSRPTVQCHDLELDASIVFADPDQASVRGSSHRHVVGHDGVDHELRMGLANAVTSRQRVPRPQLLQHLIGRRSNAPDACSVHTFQHPAAVSSSTCRSGFCSVVDTRA